MEHSTGDGATRTSSRIVSFRRPFVLSSIEEPQPAGDYPIETDEERLATASITAYRRSTTWIRLPDRGRGGVDRLVNIDPLELEAALARDAAPLPAHTPAIGRDEAGSPRPVRTRRSRFTFADWLLRNGLEMRWILGAVIVMSVLGFLMRFDLPGAGR